MGIRNFFRHLGEDNVRRFEAAEAYQITVDGDYAEQQRIIHEHLQRLSKTYRTQHVAESATRIVGLLEELIEAPGTPKGAITHLQQAIGHLGAAGLIVIESSPELTAELAAERAVESGS